MGFKSAVTKRAFCALRYRSTPWLVYRSILALQYRPIVDLDGHLGCLLQISPKCSKIITYLQNIHDLINIINRLFNNINISKNAYKLWMKMGQINSLSIFQDTLCCARQVFLECTGLHQGGEDHASGLHRTGGKEKS